MTRGAEKERSTIGSQPPTPVGFTVGDVTQRALRRWVPFVNAGYPALQVRAAMPQPALRCCRGWLPRGSKPPSYCRQRPDAQWHIADAILSKSICPDGEDHFGSIYDLFYQIIPGTVVFSLTGRHPNAQPQIVTFPCTPKVIAIPSEMVSAR